MPLESSTDLNTRCELAMDRLASSGLRRTSFRRKLFALLLDSEPYALSVGEIRGHPIARKPDAVTVYRNVEVLTRIGLLDRITDEKGRSRYRLSEVDGPNLKIACRDCHATVLHPSPRLPELESLAQELGYSGISSRWEITGYCEDCGERRASRG